MAQSSDTRSHPIALDFDSTLVLAIELSNTSWVLAAQVPGLPRVKAKQSIEPTAEALLAAIDGYRDRARAAGKTVQRVVATYEASWSGFWLARWLARRGIETHVVQPSSVPVDRRARRAKSDGIDAELLLRTLLAWLRGEPRVCSMAPIPDEADEDERRRVREREDLLAERVRLVNRIGAVLATLGCVTIIRFGGIGVSDWTRYARRSGIRFHRTPAPEYFACSTAWSCLRADRRTGARARRGA
jgi:transposase